MFIADVRAEKIADESDAFLVQNGNHVFGFRDIGA